LNNIINQEFGGTRQNQARRSINEDQRKSDQEKFSSRPN